MLSFLPRFPWFLGLLFFMDEQDDQVSSILSFCLKVCFIFRYTCRHRRSRGPSKFYFVFSFTFPCFLGVFAFIDERDDVVS